MLGDPWGRALLWRIGSIALATGLAGSLGLGWALGVGLIGSFVLARHLMTAWAPLRREVLELEGPDQSSASIAELVDRVRRARERLARERSKAERERDDLMGVLEASTEGIVVLDGNQRVELLNGAARRLLQAPIDAPGRHLHELSRDRALIQYAESLAAGESPPPLRVEVSNGGGTLSLFVSGDTVPGNPERQRSVLVLHDGTHLQHLERVRTDFVANVTHEMRSPLAAILGYAETLETDCEESEETIRDSIQRILRNARRMDGIIRDLIQLSRLENASAPQLEATDVRAMVSAAVADYEDLAGAKRIELVCEHAGLPPRLDLDADLVRQALVNLLDNAVKFTPEGGRVEVASSLEGDELHLSVRDTGPGIPLEHRARIFERFYRIDTARSRQLGGTGLGLSIVKHAAALHGGTVRVESELGRGTSFELSLPVFG